MYPSIIWKQVKLINSQVFRTKGLKFDSVWISSSERAGSPPGDTGRNLVRKYVVLSRNIDY